MEPLDQILSWTDTQIESEIVEHLPLDGSDFVCEWLGNVWSARIEAIAEGQPGRVLHAVEHVDRRMALYAVYGHLWMQGHPAPVAGSLWDPSAPRPTVGSVSDYVRSMLPDPEDLDPEEVAAVYGIPSTKKDGPR